MSPLYATAFAFAAWALSWLAAAFWSDPAAKRPALGQEWLYRLITIVGAIMLFEGFRRRRLWAFGHERLWDLGPEIGWMLFGVAVLGLLFTWWARLHLGRLWSGSVTRKAEHHVVDTGPYAIVRHPIYTGLIVAAIALAAQESTLTSIAGALVLIVGYWIKARVEESFLREQLGAEAYDSYRRRVPMLVPLGPRSR